MMLLYLFPAILLLTLGHICKAMRWKLFTSVYETTPVNELITSLSAGYLINFFIPLHAGDLFRIWFAGRKMKNGLGYASATVIVDRCLDVLAVCGIFLLFQLLSPTDVLPASLLTYGIMVGVIVVLCFLGFFCAKGFKQISLSVSSLFNEKIKYYLLFFLWSLISSFKDLFRKVSSWKLLLWTLLMWGSYLGSYYFIGQTLGELGYPMGIQDCFRLLFGGEALLGSTFLSTTGLFRPAAELALCLYILLPLPILLLWGLLPSAKNANRKTSEQTATLLLPHRKQEEQLHFLNLYFEGNQRQALHTYLNMNSDVVILRDYSSGSDATTMLCLKGNETIFRKYAFGSGAKKLQEQAQWLQAQQGKLPLPTICGEKAGADSFLYDMPYPKAGMGLFQYIYCHSVEESSKILQRVLSDLDRDLHGTPKETVSPEDLECYIQEKVLDNLKRIRQSKLLRPLTETDYIYINGVKYKNLPLLEELFSPDHLLQIFSHEPLTEVHGDLTLENIICYSESRENVPYYLIDPNTGNPVRSPYIDYAKLLQSLHGKYEFLETCHPTQMGEGMIDFLLPDSSRVREIYMLYRQWLLERFPSDAVRSIYYHEMIHWLRLMPYRLRRNESTAPCYYAAMILIMNDIAQM